MWTSHTELSFTNYVHALLSFTKHMDKPYCKKPLENMWTSHIANSFTNYVEKPYCTQLYKPCGQTIMHSSLLTMLTSCTAHNLTSHVDNPLCTPLCKPCGQAIQHSALQNIWTSRTAHIFTKQQSQTILRTVLQTSCQKQYCTTLKTSWHIPYCQIYKPYEQVVLHIALQTMW